MASRRHPSSVRLILEQLEQRETPSASIISLESFDAATTPGLPSGFSQWSSGGASFATSTANFYSSAQSLSTSGSSAVAARLWQNQSLPADDGVQATIYTDSLIPVQIFARGQNLASSTPSYYAVSVTRGLQIDLICVNNGVGTTLGSIKSASYLSGKWVRVNLQFDGDKLAVEVVRTDTGQYLNAAGNWVATPASALQATDSTIAAGGYSGINRVARYAGTAYVDDFAIVGPGTTVSENFNTASVGGLPSGWSRWSSDGALGFGASSSSAIDGLALTSAGTSTRASRAWSDDVLASDVQAAASVYVDSLIPAQIFVRGSDLTTATPDYYAVSVTRGLSISIVKVVNGTATVLGTATSKTYTSGLWLRVSLTAQGNNLQARVQRLDTGMWLDKFGNWQSDPAAALDATDSSITGMGRAGLARSALYSGNVSFDNFDAGPGSNADITAPNLQITIPSGGQNLSGLITIGVSASDPSGIRRVEYYVDSRLVATATQSPFDWNLDTRNWGNGTHALSIRAFDNAGNVAIADNSVSFSNQASFQLPQINRHYSHIRVAELAYSGNPMGTTEITLLQNSIDLVVANSKYLSTIDQASPNTPQLIYSNVSNLYQELLTDWLTYADKNGVSREAAFYHVSEATSFTGASASSQPVTWFWNVERGPGAGTTGFTRLTSAAHDSTASDITFGSAGQAIYLGYTDKFREINFDLPVGRQSGWTYVVEYASAVDSSGTPTEWKTLNLVSDSTNGFTWSGRWTFDPPSDWKTAIISGSTAPLYYVRIRTLTGDASQGPVASSILGRDYVNARGGYSGTIPAFDLAADLDGDGYLNDAEYATRAAGKDARFLYESRLFYPYYGQMRFVTNPESAAVQNWAADYHERLLASQPLADGIFMDNSSGKNPVAGYKLVESSATYGADYSALLATVNRAISPKWVMANTANGNADTDLVVEQVPATLEEFGIRAMSHNWQQFSDLANTVKERQSLTSPPGYLILDSLSTGGSPTDGRTQMATLAYYYLIGNSQSTMLMLWGGEEPASSWSRHWFNALTYNVGQAQGDYSLFATGTDPANPLLTYNIFQRQYNNALVLYKPLSYARGQTSGTTGDNTATTHNLGGTYRLLYADGTLGAPITSITLRNGEGAVLIKA